ncbi:hypothetical protein [Rhodococcus rhodnii]|uniref:Uncharacterized protein n=1 Tax=Rhodococcus rhodnii LMG 5362 TaxID=1273125 RepID=R7WRX4_9NOCA|nr:hypothetical protein [Rhodococcus rhodnii]EOM78087.1 hypothetical protein Rrhod_0537 [Rhodococcus rhodnii LMG 5362]
MGVVGLVVLIFFLLLLALKNEWVVFGPAHRTIVRLLEQARDHSQAREAEDAKTIQSLTQTVARFTVTGEASVHGIETINQLADKDRQGSS